MEYLEDNLHEWLAEELSVCSTDMRTCPVRHRLRCVTAEQTGAVQAFGEDDYLLVDCPGQLELFTHIPVLRTFVDYMKQDGWNVCAVFCLDSHFITDSAKFIAGCFQALSTMVALELPHMNVLTKVDLLEDKVCCNTAVRVPQRTCRTAPLRCQANQGWGECRKHSMTWLALTAPRCWLSSPKALGLASAR